ncbi:hypothetical protein MRX96_056501 [Rhipicephalus microplus]
MGLFLRRMARRSSDVYGISGGYKNDIPTALQWVRRRHGVRSLPASLLDFTGGRSYQQMQFFVVRCARAPITVFRFLAVYASTAPAFQAFNLSSAYITGNGNGLEWDCFYGAWHGAAVTSTASAVDIRTTSRRLLFSGSGGGMASDRYKLVCLILQVAAVTSRCSSSSSDVRVLPSQFPDSWAVYASTDPAFQAFNFSSAFITGTGNGLEWDCFYGAWHGAAVTSTASAVDIGTTSRQLLFSGFGGGMASDRYKLVFLILQVAAVTSRCSPSSSDVRVLPSQFRDSWAVYTSTNPAFQAFNLSSAFITGTVNGLEWDCFYGAWHGAAVTSTASAVDIGTTSRHFLFSGSGGGMASDRYKLVCLILQVAAVTSRYSSSSSDVRVLPSQFPDSWAVYASTDPAFQAFNLSSAFITGTGNGLEWECFYGAWHGAAVKSTASAVDIGTTSRQFLFSGSGGGMASDRYKLVCLILQVAAVTSRCSPSSSDVSVLPSQFPDSWAVYASTDPAFQAFNLSSAFITATGNRLEWNCFYGAWHGAAVTSTASAVDIRTTSRKLFSGSGGGMASDRYKLVCLILQVAAVTSRCSSSSSDVHVLPSQFPDSWAVYASTDSAFQAFNLSSAFITGTGNGLEWDCFYGAWHGAAVTSTASAVDIGTTSRQLLFSGSGGGMASDRYKLVCLILQVAAVTSRCSSSSSDVRVLPSQFPDSWAVYASTDPAFQAFNLSSAFITGTGNGLEWDFFYGAWHGAAVTSTASAVDIRTTSRQLFSGSGGGMASDRYKLVCLILQVAAVTSRCRSSSSDVRVLPSQFPDSWAVYASTDSAFQAFNLSSAFITGTGNGLEWDCFYGAWHGAAVTSTASAVDIGTTSRQFLFSGSGGGMGSDRYKQVCLILQVAAVTSRCSSSSSDVRVLPSQFPDSWAVYASTDPAFQAFNLSPAFIMGTGNRLEWDCFFGAWHGAAVTSTASAVDIRTTSRQLFSGSGGGMASDRYKLVCLTLHSGRSFRQMQLLVVRCARAPMTVSRFLGRVRLDRSCFSSFQFIIGVYHGHR